MSISAQAESMPLTISTEVSEPKWTGPPSGEKPLLSFVEFGGHGEGPAQPIAIRSNVAIVDARMLRVVMVVVLNVLQVLCIQHEVRR